MSIQERLVRYDQLEPCTNAFIDTRSPGSDKKENFTIIGPGVSENPAQHIHIAIPHGFNIGGARQPPGCLNSQHSHLTAEVFLVHSGTWAFRTGVDAEDGEIVLGEGDVISLPTDVFRGFENIGEDTGYLYAILGGDNPGRVTWAPKVFDMARDYGLILLDDGSLVDTTLGESVPAGKFPMPRTSKEQVAVHRVIGSEQMQSIVCREADYPWSRDTVLSSFDGVEEAALLGTENKVEAVSDGALNWKHGFVLRVLKLQAGACIPTHRRVEEEVIFILDGVLTIQVGAESLKLQRGDTFTTPIEAARSFTNSGSEPCVAYFTRRGDTPGKPVFN